MFFPLRGHTRDDSVADIDAFDNSILLHLVSKSQTRAVGSVVCYVRGVRRGFLYGPARGQSGESTTSVAEHDDALLY